MAEFLGVSTDAPDLPTAVTPKAGVEDLSSAQATQSLAATVKQGFEDAVDLVEGFGAIKGDTAIGEFSLNLLDIGDAVAQGLKPKEAQMRARESLTAFIAANPSRAEDAIDIFAKILNQTGAAKNVTEESDATRRARDFADRAIAAGYVLDDGTPDTGAFQTFLELEREGKALGQRLTLLQQEDTLVRGRTADERAAFTFDQELLKIDNRNLLVKVVGNRIGVNLTELKDLTKRAASGELDANQVAATIASMRAGIQDRVLQSAATAGPDFANAVAAPILAQITAYEEIIAGGKITASLKNDLDRALLQTKINMIAQEPDLLIFMGLSETLRNVPLQLLPQVNQLMVRLMSGVNPVGNDPNRLGKVNVTDPENEGLVSDFFSLLRGAFANTDKDDVAAQQSNTDNLTSILKSLDVFSGAVDNTSDYNAVANLIGSIEAGKQLVEQGGVPPEVLTKAADVFQTQYNQVLLPMIQQNWLEATVLSRSRLSADKKSVTTLVEPIFTGSGVIFRVAEDVPAEFRAIAAGAVIDLNKDTAQALNQVIRIDAHLSGTLNYQKVWEQRYNDLFEVVPVPEGEEGGEEGFTLKKFFEGRAGTGSLFDPATGTRGTN